MSARLEVHPARPERRVLIVTQCFFCGKRWAPKPPPEHDEVRVEEGFCPDGCEMESEFFGWKRPREER